MSTATIETFTTSQLCAEVGVPLTTLHRWAQREPEMLGPTFRSHGSGSRRQWTVADRARIRKAAAFRRLLTTFYAGAETTISPRAMAAFVREAFDDGYGNWVWATDCFTLIVARDLDGC